MTNPFYTSAAWQRARRTYLAAYPICETAGCGRAAKHVDHKTPISRGGAPFDPRNFRSLCHSCHSIKTATFDRRGVAGEVRARGCDANGIPRDPKHHWRQ